MADLETFRSDVRLGLEANAPPPQTMPMAEDDALWRGRNGSAT